MAVEYRPETRKGGNIIRKVKINHDECLGDAVCEDICPEVFKIKDDDLAYVINDNPGPELEEKIQEAIDECPNGAITWED